MKEKQIMGVTLAFWCQSGRSGETDVLTEASTQTDSRLPAYSRRAVLSKCDAEAEKYIPGLGY